jgi:hypothetical protein
MYLPLEAFLQEYGFDERECLLRSICEAAHSSFNHEDKGLLEEIAHAVLTYVKFITWTSGYKNVVCNFNRG